MPRPPRPQIHQGTVVSARRPFLMGPGNDEIAPGDVLDLADPGWGLLPRAARILIEHGWVEIVTGKVSRVPSEHVTVDVLAGADNEGA